MPPSLGGIPNEIKQQIIRELVRNGSYEGREALKSLRLYGDRVINDLATQKLFETIGFWFGLKSLRNLSQLSERQNLTIVFCPLRFRDSPSDTPKEIAEALNDRCLTYNEGALALMQYKSAFERYMSEQRHLTGGGDHRVILTRCLRQFSKVNKIDIAMGNPYIGARELYESFGVLSGQQILHDCQTYTATIFGAIQTAGSGISILGVGNDCRDPEAASGSGSQRAVLPIMKQSRASVTMCSKMVAIMSKLAPRHPMWTNIQELSISGVRRPAAASSQLQEASLQMMRNMFSCCKGIKAFTYKACDGIMDGHAFFLELLPEVRCLESLELHNFVEFGESDVVTFYKALADTIDTVTLNSCDMYLGTWLSVSKNLRAAKPTSLKQFTVLDSLQERARVDELRFITSSDEIWLKMKGVAGVKL